MKVIFIKDVSGVARMYDVKNVADGYALNFLLPRGMAKRATPDVVKKMEEARAAHDSEIKIQENLLIKSLETLKDTTVALKGKANEKGHLFSGIHGEEISKALKIQTNIEVDPRLISLKKPIKEIGEHTIDVVVGDNKGSFKLEVIAE